MCSATIQSSNTNAQRSEMDMDYFHNTPKRFKAPKGITDCEAVEECNDGPAEGFDYKYDVFLKEGWVFENGRMEGGREGRFNTVKDFKYANPIPKTA